MCAPVAAPLLMAGVSAIGTGFQVAGALEQGDADKAAADANAAMAERAAQDAEMRGRQQAGEARQQGSEAISGQKVAWSASGLDMRSGTPLGIMADTRMMSELDAQQLLFNSQREAQSDREQGANFSAAGQRAQSAAGNRAWGAAFSGASDIAGRTYNYFNPKRG